MEQQNKVLNLEVPFDVPEADRQSPEFTSYAEMTQDYINYAVHSTNPQGLDGQIRRVWGRIQRKIADAIEKKTFSVELEPKELDFVRKAFAECKFPAKLSRYVLVLEEELGKL